MMASNCAAAFLTLAGSLPVLADFALSVAAVEDSLDGAEACCARKEAAAELEEAMEATFMLVDHQFGLEGAGTFQSLEDRHHFPRRNT